MCEPDISFETAYYYTATIAMATFTIATITIAITITTTMLHTRASLNFFSKQPITILAPLLEQAATPA